MTQVTDEMLAVFTKACWGEDSEAPHEYKLGFQALLNAKLISLPVDEAAIRESVVREAVEWLQAWGLPNHAKHLEVSLLPTKDRAKELAKEYLETATTIPGRTPEQEYADFARWMIEREVVNG